MPEDARDKQIKAHRRLRIRIRIGQLAMAVGALTVASHWFAHLVITEGPPGIQDLLIGYPTGVALIVLGALLAGQNQAHKYQ